MKRGKARDPSGLVNEIFKPDVAGSDLIDAILLLMNRIKSEQKVPEDILYANITTIYKGKGSKMDMKNDRGVFGVIILRYILDKLIYNDEISNIDEKMTDSNIGCRKKRNIRDNIFVMNAIINSATKKETGPIDVQVYDLAQCFDSLWIEEALNDLFETNLNNDKFEILYQENSKINVCVKTPYGKTEYFKLEDVLLQGTVFPEINCSLQIDKLGKMAYENGKTLFLYKNTCRIPPLGMVDDLIAAANCGTDSIRTNAIITAFIESKKLQFGTAKCHSMHIGKECSTCPDLKVHTSDMEKSNSEKYLGDILSNDGSNKQNIESRKTKAWAIASEILAILREIPPWKI